MPRSFVPTEEQRQKAKAMAGFGLKQEQIAILLELSSVATLRKHFRQELTRGPIEAKVNVRKTLFKMATSGRDSATLIWTHLPAKVGPTRRPSGLLNGEGQWTGEPKWNFSKRSGESTSLAPERCGR